MRIFLTISLIIISFLLHAQSDIDVVYMKDGSRIECEIQEIRNDSIFFTEFSGRATIEHAVPLDETAAHLVNNFYTTPGEELIKASRNLKFGAGIALVGGTVAYLGYRDDRDNLMDLGVGVTAVGTIICILSFNNLKKAGKKLNKIDFEGDRLIFKL